MWRIQPKNRAKVRVNCGLLQTQTFELRKIKNIHFFRETVGSFLGLEWG